MHFTSRIRSIVELALVISLAFLLANLTKGWYSALLGVSTSSSEEESQLFDLYSLSSDRSHERLEDNAIVILSADSCERTDIARLISIAGSCEPAAIGLDILFDLPQDNDSLLISAIDSAGSIGNIVLPIVPVYDTVSCSFVSYRGSYFYDRLASSPIFASVIISDNPIHGVIRQFKPFFDIEGVVVPNIGTCLAELYDPESVRVLRHRCNEMEYINYYGHKYEILDGSKVLECACSDAGSPRNLFEGRIVIIGLLDDVKDLKVTPVGSKSGCVVISSIISTILGSRYVRVAPQWAITLLSILLCLIFLLAKMRTDRKNNLVGSMIMRIFQFGILIVMLEFGSIVFSRSNYYIDFSYPILMTGYTFLAYDIYLGIKSVVNRITKHNVL